MLLSIKMAIIRQEKRKLVARMKIGKLRKAKTGARVNGIYPYGDDPRRPEETATLHKMRELRASGATCPKRAKSTKSITWKALFPASRAPARR